MRPKRVIALTVVLAVLLSFGGVFYSKKLFRSTVTQQDSPEKIIEATFAYRRSLLQQGKPLPEYVNINELIQQKFLNPEDVEGFAQADVNVKVTPNLHDPNEILIKIKFMDGTEAALYMDSTIHGTDRKNPIKDMDNILHGPSFTPVDPILPSQTSTNP